MTTHKHHVLCAVDYSASSRTALRYASVAAQQIGATLTVLNVADPLLVAAMRTYGVTDWPQREREELRAFCRETRGRDHGFDVDVRVGRPEDEIHGVSRTLGADLLVIGSHGLTGVRKVFGSMAERVLRESEIPVLVTPTDVHAQRRPRMSRRSCAASSLPLISARSQVRWCSSAPSSANASPFRCFSCTRSNHLARRLERVVICPACSEPCVNALRRPC
jgi:nucleotide-binding universal stress UspA family protein